MTTGLANELVRLASWEADLKRREELLALSTAELQKRVADSEKTVQQRVADGLRAGLFKEIEEREAKAAVREAAVLAREKTAAAEEARIKQMKVEFIEQIQGKAQ
jgi:hypothetical protein